VSAESSAIGQHRLSIVAGWQFPGRGSVGAMTQQAPLRRLTELEKVLRAFVRDGRLVSIPAKPKKRELLLPYILEQCFPEDRDYEEKEVNQRLGLLHRDVASLRRYLVDAGLMTRKAGIYRRAIPPDPTPADDGA
jgi:hypothetical protein